MAVHWLWITLITVYYPCMIWRLFLDSSTDARYSCRSTTSSIGEQPFFEHSVLLLVIVTRTAWTHYHFLFKKLIFTRRYSSLEIRTDVFIYVKRCGTLLYWKPYGELKIRIGIGLYISGACWHAVLSYAECSVRNGIITFPIELHRRRRDVFDEFAERRSWRLFPGGYCCTRASATGVMARDTAFSYQQRRSVTPWPCHFPSFFLHGLPALS